MIYQEEWKRNKEDYWLHEGHRFGKVDKELDDHLACGFK